MIPGQVDMARAGGANQPSPAIWADCPGPSLNQSGEGYFFHAEFLGVPVAAAALPSMTVDGMNFDGDTDTVFTRLGTLGGVIDIETDGDDNDAAAIFTSPCVKIVPNSGNKVWVEARVELGELADQGFFFGLVENDGLSRDVVADDAGALVGKSLVGFQVLADDTDGLDIVYKRNAGSAVQVGTTKAIAAAQARKLGLRFDGARTIEFFVDGVKTDALTINNTFPSNVAFGVIACLKTGTGAARSFAADFVRVAGMGRS